MSINNNNFIPKFVPVENSKALISLRLNVSTIEKLERLAYKSKLSRNEYIKQIIEHVLQNIDENEEAENK